MQLSSTDHKYPVRQLSVTMMSWVQVRVDLIVNQHIQGVLFCLQKLTKSLSKSTILFMYLVALYQKKNELKNNLKSTKTRTQLSIVTDNCSADEIKQAQ